MDAGERFGRLRPALAVLLVSGCAVISPKLAPDEIPAAVHDLGGADRKARVLASQALLRTGAPAVPALVEALKKGNETQRFRVARALGLMGPAAAEAVPALAGLLRDETVTFPSTVADALGGIGAAALNSATEALKDRAESARYWSVAVLERLAPKEGAALDALVPALGDDSAAVSARAEAALGRLGRRAIPALARGVTGEDLDVRNACGRLLAELDDPEARAALSVQTDRAVQTVGGNASATVTAALVSSTVAVAGPLHVAVADLGAQGVSPSDAAIASDWLRNELVTARAFVVVERQQMERVLAEQSLQQTGCTTESCAVKLGRLLNVQRMIVGSFGKFLGVYVINVRVVSVESGAVVWAGQARGKDDRALGKGIKDLAARMASEVR